MKKGSPENPLEVNAYEYKIVRRALEIAGAAFLSAPESERAQIRERARNAILVLWPDAHDGAHVSVVGHLPYNRDFDVVLNELRKVPTIAYLFPGGPEDN